MTFKIRKKFVGLEDSVRRSPGYKAGSLGLPLTSSLKALNYWRDRIQQESCSIICRISVPINITCKHHR